MSEDPEIYGNLEIEYRMKQKRLDLELIQGRINLRKHNRDAMLEAIMLSEPVGLSTDELKNKLGCHRDTIHSLGFELQNEGLVTKDGKFGKYHLTRRSLQDPEVSASFLGAKIMRDFYRLGQEPISIKNIFCNQSLCKSALTEDDMESKQDLLVKGNFFEFALRLGAIITYQIIQSIRYCQKDAPGSSPVCNTSSKLRDGNMLKYIQNIMNPSSLIFVFRDLYSIDKRLKDTICSERDQKLHVDQLKTRPSILEFQEGKFEELDSLFQETFPELYEDLEKIRIDIPKEIEARQQSLKEKMKKIKDDPVIKRLIQLEKEDPNHTECDGKLLHEIRKNQKGKNVKKCSKCLRWIPVKRGKHKN